MTPAPVVYPGPTPANLDAIPAVLKARRQWVLWRGTDRIDQVTGAVKLNKIPINAHSLHPADSTDPTTWATFAECVAALPVALEEWETDDPAAYRGGGIGYVFADDDPYVGIDLDGCVDEITGAVADWAQQWLDRFQSYGEITPSTTGLHILTQGTLPPRGRKKGAIEMYSYARFFTMTGWHLDTTPPTIEPRAPQLAALWCALFGPTVGQTVWLVDTHGTLTNHDGRPWAIVAIEPAPDGEPFARFAESATGWPLIRCEPGTVPSGGTAPPPLDDDAVMQHMLSARNKAKVERLGTCQWQKDYTSQSEADLALCCLLAFWTRDPAQMDRLFRATGLMRAKWDERRGDETYGARTIREALARQSEHYTPARGASLLTLATPQAQAGQNGQAPGAPAWALQDLRPVIRLGPDITRMVDEGQAALLALPAGPTLFQRARRLTLIAHGVKPPPYLHRSADAPVIVEAHAAYLDELATQAAHWEKYDKRAKKGEEWVEVTPPSRFVQTLQARPSWPFPLLEGIIQSPTLRPDGSLLVQPGYDASTGLYLDFNGTTFPSLSAFPTFDEARSALRRLIEVFEDFPFAIREPSAGTLNPYLSATLAAVLTLVGRPAIAGNVPLFGVTATAAGSGKGKLVDAICRIGTGRYAPKMGQTLDENEELKRLLALALEGASVCCIDNVTHPLGNQYLDMALTAQAITGRILGQTQTAEAPWNAVLFATGNNLSYRGDMTRRVVPIALDPKMEKPPIRRLLSRGNTSPFHNF